MIIYGASGHAKVIIDICKSVDKKIDFIMDDNPEIKSLLGFQVSHKMPNFNDQSIVFGIGDNRIRRRLALKHDDIPTEKLIHKSAIISKDSEIKTGTVVMPKVIVNSSTKIGRHCILNTGCVIEHDVEIGDFVHVSPSATITGNVSIEEGTQVGAGVTIIPGIKIGKWVTIGAGTVIIGDIPDYAVVVGNPGKVIKFNTQENE